MSVVPLPDNGRIAYVLKGFPRLSESFIVNEIRQMVSRNVPLGLFSIKRGEPSLPIDDLPPVHYAPPVSSLSSIGLVAWLRQNLPLFMEDQRYWMRSAPLRHLATLGFALRLAFRHRDAASGRIRKAHVKEFLFASHIARRIHESGGYDHVHAHFCHDATTVAWMVGRLCDLPFSFTAHAKDIYVTRLNPGDLLQRKLDAASFAVTCTETNARELRRIARQPDKVHGLYHGLDTRLFYPANGSQCRGNGPRGRVPRLLSIGRHVEKKGFAYLLEACLELRRRDIEFSLDIIGEPGDQTPRLRELIDSGCLYEQVRLLTPVNQPDLVAHYRNADLFVLPCIVLDDGDRDGIPNVMAEAMACGLPVVVTAMAGIAELVEDRVNGRVVAQRDSMAVADAIEWVLEDAVRSARMGAAARKTVEACFDADVTHAHLKHLFDVHRSNRVVLAS